MNYVGKDQSKQEYSPTIWRKIAADKKQGSRKLNRVGV